MAGSHAAAGWPTPWPSSAACRSSIYLLHIPLIHLAAVGVSILRTGAVSPWLFANHPMEPGPPPPESVWSLPLLYAVTAAVVVVLYLPCRWYGQVKQTRTHPLLSLV